MAEPPYNRQAAAEILSRLKQICLDNQMYPIGVFGVQANSKGKKVSLAREGHLQTEVVISVLREIADELEKEGQRDGSELS